MVGLNREGLGVTSTKQCKECLIHKDFKEFHKQKTNRHGFNSLCKTCRSIQSAKDYKEKWFNKVCNLKRSFCKIRGLPFNLTAEYLESLWVETCPVLGLPLIRGDKTADNGAALDRIDPKKGYVKGNVAYISARANRIKYDASLEELKKLVEWYEKVLDSQKK